MFTYLLILVFIHSIDCSYNIALNKTAFQSSNFTKIENVWTADKAVDGDLKTDVLSDACSVTDDNITISVVWWYVDLVETSRVSSVRIVYRNDYHGNTHRLAGFSLFMSNDSDLETGHQILCYKDQSNTTLPATDQSINCDIIGRYVTIYNERLPSHIYPDWYSKFAMLELCEVQVYGCPFGRFGNNNCDKECSTGCRDGDCLPNNGSCVRGCRNGWKGQACDECLDGRYGELCNRMCSIGCLNITCNKETGSCDGRCKDNWKGPNCDVCVDGFFGNTCNQNCSIGCNQAFCDKTDGSCLCSEGWSGKNCNVCFDGIYGRTCSRNCSIGCNQTICDKTDGSCSCLEGWFGKTCNENYQGEQVEDKKDEQVEDKSINYLPIILGISAGLNVILIVTVTILVWRKRQMKNSRKDSIGHYEIPTHMANQHNVGGENRIPETTYQHLQLEAVYQNI